MRHEPHLNIAAGIIIALVAALIQSFGLTLQRKSHVENEVSEKRRSDFQRPQVMADWLYASLHVFDAREQADHCDLVIIFITSNTLGSIFQIGALPIVVLAPLGGVSLIWNALFARLILGDSFSRYLIIGTIMIASGAVLIAVNGTLPEPNHSLPELLQLFSRVSFVVWITALSIVVALVLATAHLFEYALYKRIHAQDLAFKEEESQPMQKIQPNMNLRRWSEPVSAFTDNDGRSQRVPSRHVSFASRSSQHTQTSQDDDDQALHRSAERIRLLVAVAYGCASGTLSGLCLLFAKVGVELLILTIYGRNQFNHWQSSLIVVALIVIALLQLWYLNRSLRLAGPTLICPLAFCFYNLSSIFNGLVFYNQFALLSRLQLGLVILGIFVLLFGVWIASFKTAGDLDAEIEEEEREFMIGDTEASLQHFDSLFEQADERTPLMLSHGHHVDAPSYTDEPEHVEASKLETLKRLIRDQPAGFQIGIGAASPGFAIRPTRQHGHQRRATVDLSASHSSLPPSLTSSVRGQHSRHGSEGDAMSTPSSPVSEVHSHYSRLRRKRRSLGNTYYVDHVIEGQSDPLSASQASYGTTGTTGTAETGTVDGGRWWNRLLRLTH